MFLNDFLNQAVLENGNDMTIIFKINDKECGSLAILCHPDTDHFQFEVSTSIESCAFGLYYRDEVIDYYSFELSQLPISSEDHGFFVPLRLNFSKILKDQEDIAKTIYIFFSSNVESLTNLTKSDEKVGEGDENEDKEDKEENEEKEGEEEDQINEEDLVYKNGVFGISRLKLKNKIKYKFDDNHFYEYGSLQ